MSGETNFWFTQAWAVLCISNSFWVLLAIKSWLKHFFWQVSNFFVDFRCFWWLFYYLKKRIKNIVLSCSLKLVNTQKLVDSLRGYHWNRSKPNKKVKNGQKKSVLTSFRVHATPQTLSKYTTELPQQADHLPWDL